MSDKIEYVLDEMYLKEKDEIRELILSVIERFASIKTIPDMNENAKNMQENLEYVKYAMSTLDPKSGAYWLLTCFESAFSAALNYLKSQIELKST